MSNEVVKKTTTDEEITNELVDKFHRALCPHCNGRCHFGRICSYDYTHTVSPVPDINEVWKRYLTALQGSGEMLEMSFDDLFELLTDDEIDENSLSEKYETKKKLHDLFNMCF